jgi:hypothetical protein
MKTTESKKPLPKFEFVTLDDDQLGKVVGGNMTNITVGGVRIREGMTGRTSSVCDADLVEDGD